MSNKKETLGDRFRRETSAFITKVLRMKGLTNAAGEPIEDRGARPIVIEQDRLVFVTDGVEIDDTPTFPEIKCFEADDEPTSGA